MATVLLIAGMAVNAWLLVVVYRQGVRRQLPWFFCYVVWEFLLACVEFVSWMVSPRLYVAVYWWLAAAAVVLTVGAVRESFLRIFEGFTSIRGFRWSIWGVIAAVVVYSAWKAVYAPPIQSNRLGTFVLGAEFMFRWGIAGIAFLTIVFSWFLREPANTRENAVVTGFGIASIAVVASAVTFSLFGTRYLFFTKYVPSVGYFVAAFLWIRAFSRPVEEFGLKELGMSVNNWSDIWRAWSRLMPRKKCRLIQLR